MKDDGEDNNPNKLLNVNYNLQAKTLNENQDKEGHTIENTEEIYFSHT